VDCRTLVEYMQTATKEVTGATTGKDIISLLVDLEVSCVQQISIGNAKAEIEFADDRNVRCPRSRRPACPRFITKVDFGITKGSFLPHVVFLTTSASSRIFRVISQKVNEDRLVLLNNGHVCINSPLKKVPSHIIEKIKSFLILYR